MKKQLKPKSIAPIYRVFDCILSPFMFLLGGLKMDSIQQTHGWHTLDVDPNVVDLKKSLTVIGSDASKFNNFGRIIDHLGVFHMPIFGGWKNYVILECKDTFWYVGWLSKGFSQAHCLPIKGSKVKVLTGIKGNKTVFFGVDKNGNQVPIKKLAQGILGDGKYKSVPLY